MSRIMFDNKKFDLKKEDIYFKCEKCGACCAVPGFVHLTVKEGRGIAAYLEMDYKKFKKKYMKYILWAGYVLNMKVNGGCIFLKEGKCGIYPARPSQCRTFPFWNEVLKDKNEWEYVKSYCPGAKKAEIKKNG